MPDQACNCPGELTVSVIGGKWKIAVLWLLRKGAQRSGKIKSQLPGITSAAFSNAVRELEEAGAIKRLAKPTLPPQVSYELTARGKTLLPILRSLVRWGSEHRGDYTAGEFGLAHLYGSE